MWQGLPCGRDCHIITMSRALPPPAEEPSAQCRLLQGQLVKLQKPEEDGEKKDVKVEKAAGPGPSPSKKMATEMEKKLKNLPGDTTLLKARICSG